MLAPSSGWGRSWPHRDAIWRGGKTLMTISKKGPWTILSQKEVYENPWIKLTHHEVLTPAQTPGIYGLIHYKNLAIGVVPVALSFHLTALPFLALAVGLATLALVPALVRGEVVVRLGFTMIGLCALPWAATTALAACVDDGPSLLPFMRAAFAPIPLVGSGLLIVMLGVAGRIEGHRRIVVASVVAGTD